jgi:hypothetical protein
LLDSNFQSNNIRNNNRKTALKYSQRQKPFKIISDIVSVCMKLGSIFPLNMDGSDEEDNKVEAAIVCPRSIARRTNWCLQATALMQRDMAREPSTI